MKKKIVIEICLLMVIIVSIILFIIVFLLKNTDNTSLDILESKNEINNVLNDISKDNNIITTKITVDGIFNKYEKQANEKLQSMTMDEKIGQIFLVRFPGSNAVEILKQYKFGGYIFFAKDFEEKTQKQVIDMINELQQSSTIPILTAVDEEGGNVVRISSNPNLAKTKFKSSMELYQMGGFEQIKQDTIEKSKLLNNLGINLNLAPVVDVSTNPNDFMYKRSLGQDTELTSIFSETVINASKGYKVSYTLKHFPGYSNNIDTHKGTSVDTRSYNDILKNDLPPFSSGIKAGAEAVLVSHNIVTSIDSNNPASLSKDVNNLLRNDLNFTGIIITDDLDMGAVSNDKNATIKALQAGNDLIIITDYQYSISSIKQALKDGIISESMLDNAVVRILAWKYYKGLM